MKKRLCFVFLALGMTLEAQRSAMRDNGEALEDLADNTLHKAKSCPVVTAGAQKKSKSTTKKTVSVKDNSAKKMATKKASSQKTVAPVQQKISMQVVSSEVEVHPHRCPLRYEWEQQPEVVTPVTKKRHVKKMAAVQADHYYCTKPDTEEYARMLYMDVAAGFLKYLIPSAQITSASYETDTINTAHTQLAPLVRAGMGVEFTGIRSLFNKNKTTRMRVGWQVLYAKQGNAVQTFYTDAGNTVPNLRGLQSIRRGEFMAVMSYDLVREAFSLEAGLGLVGGALGDLRLYQVGPNYVGYAAFKPYDKSDLIFIGQTLKPNKASCGGFVGFTLSHRFECLKDTRCEFGYRSVFNTVKYKTQIYQTVPDVAASVAYQNAYALAQLNGAVVLPTTPKIKVRAQEITFGVVREF